MVLETSLTHTSLKFLLEAPSKLYLIHPLRGGLCLRWQVLLLSYLCPLMVGTSKVYSIIVSFWALKYYLIRLKMMNMATKFWVNRVFSSNTLNKYIWNLSWKKLGRSSMIRIHLGDLTREATRIG